MATLLYYYKCDKKDTYDTIKIEPRVDINNYQYKIYLEDIKDYPCDKNITINDINCRLIRQSNGVWYGYAQISRQMSQDFKQESKNRSFYQIIEYSFCKNIKSITYWVVLKYDQMGDYIPICWIKPDDVVIKTPTKYYTYNDVIKDLTLLTAKIQAC